MPPRVLKARKSLKVDLARRRRRVIPTRARRKTRRNEGGFDRARDADGDDDESYLHKVEEFPTLGGVGEGGGGGGGGEKPLRLASRGVPGENPWSNAAGRRGYRREDSPRRVTRQALHACMIHS